MSDVRNLLISGSEKVIGHYRVLLAGARSESERALYHAPGSSASSVCLTICGAACRSDRRREGKSYASAADNLRITRSSTAISSAVSAQAASSPAPARQARSCDRARDRPGSARR